MKTTEMCVVCTPGLNRMAYQTRTVHRNRQHQRVSRSSPVLAMSFGPSTLGTVCCSSGKSVKLTELREFGQIMWPVSSMEVYL